MSDRSDLHTALGLILHRMDEITLQMGQPGTDTKSLQESWNRLEMKYRGLMERLEKIGKEHKENQPEE